MKNYVCIIMCFLAGMETYSQEFSETDTIPTVLERINSDLSSMKKLKISGYLQSQVQFADTAGIESYAGGNFSSGFDNRIGIRRGRVKFGYTNDLSMYVLQIDATEKGISLKDAYLQFTDPVIETFTFTGGVFDRPFGYEISYSSSLRESPERSRLFQTLFPGERDLGGKITIQPPKHSRYNFIKFEGGVFNGTGPTVTDFDNYKDIISHLSFNRSFLTERLNIGFGCSYYNGGWRQGTNYRYLITDVMQPDNSYIRGFSQDSTHGNIRSRVRREYKGLDIQITFQSSLGITVLRGEYITGRQPSTAKSSVSPSAQPVENTIYRVNGTTATPYTAFSDAYLRDFEGGYIYFVHNIMQTKHQVVAKYDWYDPNTRIARDQIGVKNSKTGAADIMYTTIGLGWIYRWNSNVKLMAYYDRVTNETTKYIYHGSTLKALSRDRNDNVLTFRVQYKF